MAVHFDVNALLAAMYFLLFVSVDVNAMVTKAIVAEIEGRPERSEYRLADMYIANGLWTVLD